MSDPSLDRGPRQVSAMEELASDPSSRSRFLKMVGGAGAASAFSIFLAACGDDNDEESATAPAETQPKSSPFGTGDLGIANYALTLEYVEADFYRKAAASGVLKGKVLDAAKRFGEHEQQHVDALTAMIRNAGGKPAAKPKTKFPLDSQDAILKLAATVENLGSAAYLGQAGRIKDKKILAAALSIHTVEARHASALNILTGKSPTPDGAFAKPASMDEVLPKVKPFLVG